MYKIIATYAAGNTLTVHVDDAETVSDVICSLVDNESVVTIVVIHDNVRITYKGLS